MFFKARKEVLYKNCRQLLLKVYTVKYDSHLQQSVANGSVDTRVAMHY